MYCHQQIDCFIVSQLFSVARHTGCLKLYTLVLYTLIYMHTYIYIYIYIHIFKLCTLILFTFIDICICVCELCTLIYVLIYI